MTGVEFFKRLASVCGTEPVFEKKTIWTPKHGSRIGNWLDVWSAQFKAPHKAEPMPLMWLQYGAERQSEPCLLYVPYVYMEDESQGAIADCFVERFEDAFSKGRTVSVWVKFAPGVLCEKAKSLEEMVLQAELRRPALPGKYAMDEEVFI